MVRKKKQTKKDPHSLFDAEELDLWDVLFVDPGLEGTGFAYFVQIEKPVSNAEKPLVTEAYEPKGRTWIRKCVNLSYYVDELLIRLDPKLVICEYQEFYSSVKGEASAGSGNIFKLTFTTGYICRAVIEQKRELSLVKPKQWKGQLTKKAIDWRIKRALGREAVYEEHVSDAVGMGITLQGIL